MGSDWFSSFHTWLKTETALRNEVRAVNYRDVDLSAYFRESMFYDEDFVFEWSRTESRVGLYSGLSGRRTLSSAVHELITRQGISGVQRIPVLDLHGIAFSKTHGCRNLEELAYHLRLPSEYPYPGLIRFETEEDFLGNIAKVDREFYGQGVVALFREWDGKLFVNNGDKSHHLAAVYRQCKEQGRQHYLNLRVRVLRIDQTNGRFILDNYYPLILNEESRYQLCRVLERFGIEWRSANMSNELEIFYISKTSKRATIVYDEITHVGAGGFFDLKRYLEELLLTVGVFPCGSHVG